MLPARFLGFSENSGDAFTFIIAVEPTEDGTMHQIFTCSVIRPRYVRETPPTVVNNGDKLEILALEDDPDEFFDDDPVETMGQLSDPPSQSTDPSPIDD